MKTDQNRPTQERAKQFCKNTNQTCGNDRSERKEMSKMKTLTVLVSMILIAVCNISNAAAYRLAIHGPVHTSANSLEFSIVLDNTASGADFVYSIGQYFIQFNTEIANGGSLSYTLVDSDLPEMFRPRNPSVNGNVLRLACNLISSDKSTLPVITQKSGEFLIAKVRLQTDAEKFADVPFQLDWICSDAKFKTKLFTHNGQENIDLTSELIFESDNNLTPDNNQGSVPVSYDLAQNYPNPFNPSTTIRYSIPEQSLVTLKVYDITGREVHTLVNDVASPGSYEITFNASTLSSGMYFYKITAGSFSKVMKMVLIK